MLDSRRHRVPWSVLGVLFRCQDAARHSWGPFREPGEEVGHEFWVRAHHSAADGQERVGLGCDDPLYVILTLCSTVERLRAPTIASYHFHLDVDVPRLRFIVI